MSRSLSSLDPFQVRPVVTYLMLGAFQRKVIFGEYATCDRREVGAVRALRMSSQGWEGAPRCGGNVQALVRPS